jgi:hypothetical protein
MEFNAAFLLLLTMTLIAMLIQQWHDFLGK